MRKHFFFLILTGAVFAVSGCGDQKIVFNGEIHRGEITYQYQIAGDTNTEVVEVLVDYGGWEGACVKEISHPEVAYASNVSGKQGQYRLEIKVPRKLGFPSADTYTLQAWAPSGALPGETSSRNEKISNYASARPGENVYVRPFLLVYHTFEETGGE
ncbi:MAG: hypothetical protein ABII20_00125 [Candidatus Omnitrophota bacterium]|nr:hypothetical protein [Candidatus Omnitrophota bacterium]MBU2528493.1 hypothetical protein [bacterium]MBU3930799.1 hypothetical protein [bacterium]MBU4122416.1 hypothetical protein [bacterium]